MRTLPSKSDMIVVLSMCYTCVLISKQELEISGTCAILMSQNMRYFVLIN